MMYAARRLFLIAAVISSAAVAAAGLDPNPTPVASSSLSSTLAATSLQSFASVNPLLLPSDASTGGEPISIPSVPDWHFSAKDQFGIPVLLKQARLLWLDVRKTFVVPALWAAVVVCLVMSVMLLIETLSMSAVSLFVKLFRRTPQQRYKWEPFEENSSLIEKEDSALNGSSARRGDGDLESGADGTCDSSGYPKVLVQIPMYNEKEVYKQSIGAACALTWPPNRIVIQVLDDSTDPVVKELVEMECRNWVKRGINIKYEVRDCRKGYKAGALKEGMRHQYVEDCEFVAIFDSDFQPHSDFLMKTIPFLISNSDIALIQARWEFVNYNECLLTRIQKMTLDYHFKVEQEAGSSTFAFFGFNGTAGVWRISAINEAGGWKDRTTVEDMDLAVRATLKGWKFLYVGDIKVKSELPSSFKAYRYQQHRWTCGAANLFRKMVKEIILTKDVSVWKKFYVAYNFFFVRKVICHIVTFMFYCVVIPISVFVPEVHLPTWGVVYIPTTISILTAIRNPSSIHLLAFWIVFENVMSLHRMKATLIGLLNVGGVNEWVVTEKLGEGDTTTPDAPLLEKHEIRLRDRIYITEILLGLFLSLCATFNLIYSRDYFYFYIYLQAVAFFIVGFGYVGTFVSRH